HLPPVEGPVPTVAPVPSASVVANGFKTPGEVFDAQISALRHDDDAAFRATFLPGMKISTEDLAACRKLLKENPTVAPSWATQEQLDYRGEKVTRVEIWTRARTGFHQTPTGMLADHVWCAPPPRVP
ncbi:MAG: hypothetical protein ACHREM_31620, partial [Polyangiales bacterium]